MSTAALSAAFRCIGHPVFGCAMDKRSSERRNQSAQAQVRRSFHLEVDPLSRLAWCWALGILARCGLPVLPALSARLQDGDTLIRLAACRALGFAGLKAGQAAAELGRLLHDESRIIQTAACRALQKLGPSAEPALPDIEKALGGDWSMDLEILEVVAAVGAPAVYMAPLLLALRADSPKIVINRAADTLVVLGKCDVQAAESICSAALQRLDSKNPNERRLAVSVLAPLLRCICSWKPWSPFCVEAENELALRLLTPRDSEMRKELLALLDLLTAR